MYQQKCGPSSSLVPSNTMVHAQHLDSGANAMDSIGGGNNHSNNPNLASKQRLRWTHELHDRFVDAVAQLGGPDSKSSDGYVCVILIICDFLFILSIELSFGNVLIGVTK